MAEQSTSKGREAIQEYKAKLKKKDVSPTEQQSQPLKSKMKEKERDEASADQLSRMPKEQRERSAREYRMKRAEQVNQNHRKGVAAENAKSAAHR